MLNLCWLYYNVRSTDILFIRYLLTESLFIRNLLTKSFDVKFRRPIKLYEDNSGEVAIAKYGNFTKNSKHIEVQYHYINENY